ncbi:MAG: CDP-archaeol synthase [Luteitalea sp.]|nr:CDP-archaeol synthase [Luteitalea sp.]
MIPDPCCPLTPSVVIRLLSAVVLLPLVIVTIWISSAATFVLALVVVALAFIEYAGLVEALGADIPRLLSAVAALTACAAVAWQGVGVEVSLLAAVVAAASVPVAQGRVDGGVLRDVAATLFPALYLGLPIGALASVRSVAGAGALLLVVLALVASDSMQYYAGRLFGRRALSPAISPKKTQEGAIAGCIAAAVVMPLLGHLWLPQAAPWLLVLVGLLVAGMGIVGDLFESALKRGAGVKDSSSLIPGHGGMLDRIDGLLFAGPVYYLALRLVPGIV